MAFRITPKTFRQFNDSGAHYRRIRTRQPSMKTIKTYPTTVEADLARLTLDAAGIPAVVIGISVGMEGGDAGVRLLVPEDRVEEALTLLHDD
jgi:hypothetical protein